MARRRRRGTGLYLVKAPATGIYQIRGTVLGQPVRESTFTTDPSLAESVRLQTEQDIHKRKVHGAAAVATFGEAAEDYLDANPQLEMQDLALVAKLNDHFGDTLLSVIDQLAVQKAAKALYPNCGPSSINRIVYTPLIAVLRNAAANKKCSLPMLKRMQVKKKLVKHAPDEWVQAFIAGCQHRKLRALVWLMTTTGCRVTEACNILWTHVDLGRGTALIEKTKNGDPRSLPLDPDLLDLLIYLKAEGDGRGRVFGYSHRVSVNDQVKVECRHLGLDYYSSHKFGRHAIATRMLNAGHTCKEVADAVGWTGASGVALVAGTYGHLEKSKVQKSMLDVSKGIGTVKKGEKVV